MGVVLGFLSALALEFTRHWLAQKSSKLEEKKKNQVKEQEQLTEFLRTNIIQKSPAWVAIKKTPKPPFISFIDYDFAPTELGYSKPQLRNLSNPNEKYIVKDIQIIGRASQCEIQIRDKKVSRKHALIRFEDFNYIINDLGSANGTFVNDERVVDNTGVPLINGDVVRVGNSEFVFGLVRPPGYPPDDSIKTLSVNSDDDFMDD